LGGSFKKSPNDYMKKVFITGNKGFIGSHLHQSLNMLGHDVIGIDNFLHASNNPVPTTYGDVRNIKDLEPYIKLCDVCFHLAAQISVDRSIDNPQETIDINILGTQNILNLARKYNKKVIFASTSEIYGSSQTEFISESHPLDCQSPYGASKVASDRMCKAYYDTFQTDVVVVRNFNTFGTYQADDSYGGVISKFTTAALKNENMFIYGDGTQQRDYMYIKDAIQAYQLALEFPAGLFINFGTGKTISVNDIARLIKEYINSSSGIVHVNKRVGEVQRLCADITSAKLLGFNPTTNFKENLKEYIDWKKANI
jgi:UDP-glucose 4-epimerase